MRTLLLLGVSLIIALPACKPVPVEDKPNAMPEKQPEWVQPSRILVASQLPEDSDLDGYIDTIPVTLYLFDERYPFAISKPGSFVFRVSIPGGKQLAEWTMDEGTTQSAMRKLRPGPGYLFKLNLIEGGGEVRQATPAELTVFFRPSDGGPELKSQGATAFRLGKAGA